ncbi:Serine/threonine-protein kinase STY13 [Camellia lanceoleosa]|uniref:Serine/threonine-protein kinase STY13 n=1 Tax=Camellia lanceoleosa TaxID=1840588 RepID=A0ACC0IL54_9ERIC|nr:Serine/threonine-protein kinase STY13 [Camellia lanceoleosa]
MVEDGSEIENGRLSTMDSIESQSVFQDEDKSEIEDEEDDEDLTPRIGIDSDDDDNSEQRLIRQALGSIPSMSKHLRYPEHNGTALSLVFDSAEMDLKIGGGDSNTQEGELGLKEKEVGSISSKDMFFGAYKIDFKSWDLQLEKNLSWVWSRDREVHSKREEWEIDLAKLDIRNVIAHGTYGTVYRGTYDGQDVAVKVLDWGEDGIATAAETAALRASFRQ